MHSASLPPNTFSDPMSISKVRLNPLRALMEMWERDGVDEDEPASDVSVMLSSMIGQQFFSNDQD